MSHYYFAYGSNMNMERMRKRNLHVLHAMPATLQHCHLMFNKRSRYCPDESRANVTFRQGGKVEGVLYELASASEIIKLDPFEGTPRFYSREVLPLQTGQGVIGGWVYIANPAVIANNLLPPRWYLEHLLAGSKFLSDEYLSELKKVACDESKQEELC